MGVWRRFTAIGVASIVLAALLGGCGFLFGSSEEAATAIPDEVRRAVPTFTSTPVTQPQPASPTPLPTPEQVAPAVVMTPTTTASPDTVVEPAPTATPAQEPQLTVDAEAVNIRSGPDTAFELIGSAIQGETFQLVAQNAQGDWWQICCVNDQPGWIFGELARVENADSVAVAEEIAAPPPLPTTVVAAPTAAPQVAEAPAPAPAAVPDPSASSAGYFDPNAAYQIVHFKVLGLGENNGGIRDSGAQHHIFLTVLDQNGSGVDGAVVKNLVGDKSEVVTGSKGPGKAEITMFYEPFKLTVASDPSGPTTSHVSNQMGLVFPHLPDLVGRLGDEAYEYGACPTLEIKCQWPIQAIHFSYEITFQKVK